MTVSAPWHEWIEASDAPSTAAVAGWLDRLETELPAHAEACREDEQRLETLWRHMVPKLDQFRPDEISHIVEAQLDAAARRGAADALVDLVRLERRRLSARDGFEAPPPSVDSETLRRLLDGITADRTSTGRAVVAEVLETLCSIALDLEITERRVASESAPIGDTLADLRNHVISAATTLRALPGNIDVRPHADEQLVAAVRRCLSRYATNLEAQLEWSGGEPENRESSSAALWVIQEVLHHLHAQTAGWADVDLRTDDGLVLVVTTPSQALTTGTVEPDWMLRCRLRLQLAGGTIRTRAGADASAIEVRLP